jgi:preprotein translocase subunit YajC
MFISPAYAQAAGVTGGFDIMTIVPLILIFVVFYFLLIRPQQKKVKEHREMVSNVRRGYDWRHHWQDHQDRQRKRNSA